MGVRGYGEEVILFSERQRERERKRESVCVCVCVRARVPVRVARLSDRWFLNSTDTKNSKCKGLGTRECSTGKRGRTAAKGRAVRRRAGDEVGQQARVCLASWAEPAP